MKLLATYLSKHTVKVTKCWWKKSKKIQIKKRYTMFMDRKTHHIVKVCIFPNLNYRLSAILVNIPVRPFVGIDEVILKFT